MGYPLMRKIEPFNVPPELVIIITKVYDYDSGIKGLCNLRLVSRCFNIPQLRAIILGSRIVEVYLDDEGMNDFDALASWTEVADNVQRIRVGIRKVSHYPFVLQKKPRLSKGPVMPGTFANEVREIIGFARNLKAAMTHSRFRWSSVAHSIIQGDFKVRETDDSQALGCQLLPPNEEFRPSDAVLQRFYNLLASFPGIKFLQSNEDTHHSIVILRDNHGVERERFTIQDRGGLLPHSNKAARCVCKQPPAGESYKWRPCKNVTTMSTFFEYPLAWMTRQFGVPTSFRDNLKTLDLNLKNKQSYGDHYVSIYIFIARFIGELLALEHLRLGIRSYDAGTDAGNAVWLILRECNKRYDFPTRTLKTLKVACVDPAHDLSLNLLDHMHESLQFLEVIRPYARKWPLDPVSKARRLEFFQTLKQMSKLSLYMPGYEYSQGLFLPEEIAEVDIASTVLQVAIDNIIKEP